MKIGLLHAFMAMALAVFTTLPAAAQSFTIDGVNYNFDGSTVSIDGGKTLSGDVVFPSSVTYEGKTYAVTSIAYDAFVNNENITSVVIPEGVTEIGSYAFSGCKNLVSANVPNSVTELGECVFGSCTNLKEIELGTGITKIASRMFNGCISLTSIKIPDNVTTIGEDAFSWSHITSIDIPDGVTGIDPYAFRICILRKH